MIMRKLKVGITERGRFRLSLRGDYEVTSEGDITRYRPLSAESRVVVDEITIGIDFHWQQTVTMVLPEEVETVAHPDGTADLYNILDVDTYLKSVISSEMSADAPLEFLKAHAIVSRSWVVGKMLHCHAETTEGKVFRHGDIVTWEDTADHCGFDVCADDHCQRYQGVARVNEAVEKAIGETSGVILADSEGRVIDARFSKCCGGRTERFSSCWQDVDYDYLPSIDDPYCNPSRLPAEKLAKVLDSVLMKYDRRTRDYYDWEVEVSGETIRRRMMERHGIDTGKVTYIEAARYGYSGRITLLAIDAEKGVFYVGKELEIRRLLSDSCLYSSDFTIYVPEEGRFILRGRGWGHGVGLCQIGAAVMAAEGASCEEILKFYYPNTILKKID